MGVFLRDSLSQEVTTRMEATVFPDASVKTQILHRYFDRMSNPAPLKFETVEEWVTRKTFLHGKLLECLGLSPLPEPVHLNPQITGELSREDYTVKRVYFQTFPQIYASGYLYMPKNVDFPVPAILNPHGHWPDGAMHPNVQSRCIALAKKGYVAFSVDSVHVTNFLIGVCSIGIMTWNNIRALDYLCSLPQVDKEKIGCTGASGGGQQTMYLAALDERVKVAAPICLVSYFKKILFSDERTHCICNHVPNLMRYTDEPEISAMIAPRPTLYLCVTGDWTAKFPAEEYPEIKDIYALLAAKDRIDCEQYDWGHDYNQPMRERVYDWFNKWLKGIDAPEEAKEPEMHVEELDTLKKLSQPIPKARGLDGIIEEYLKRFIFTPLNLNTAAEWTSYQDKLRQNLKGLLGNAETTPPNPAIISRVKKNYYTREKLTFKTGPDIPIPGLLFIPKVKLDAPLEAEKLPVVIVVHPEGKAKLLPSESYLTAQLLKNGHIVFAIDPRLTGELDIKWDLNSVIWGRPEAGMAVTDIQGAIDYLYTRKDVDKEKIGYIGIGEAGFLGILAGGLDERIGAVACDDIGLTYRNGRSAPIISNILRYADIPQITTLIAPRALLLNAPSSSESFADVAKIYKILSAQDRLKLTYLPVNEARASLATWMTKNIQ